MLPMITTTSVITTEEKRLSAINADFSGDLRLVSKANHQTTLLHVGFNTAFRSTDIEPNS